MLSQDKIIQGGFIPKGTIAVVQENGCPRDSMVTGGCHPSPPGGGEVVSRPHVEKSAWEEIHGQQR